MAEREVILSVREQIVELEKEARVLLERALVTTRSTGGDFSAATEAAKLAAQTLTAATVRNIKVNEALQEAHAALRAAQNDATRAAVEAAGQSIISEGKAVNAAKVAKDEAIAKAIHAGELATAAQIKSDAASETLEAVVQELAKIDDFLSRGGRRKSRRSKHSAHKSRRRNRNRN